MGNCVYPQYGKKRTTYRAIVSVRGELVHIGAFHTEEAAQARIIEFKSTLPKRKRGEIVQIRERFYPRLRVRGSYRWFGSFPNHYEARKALEKGIETLGLHPYR